MATTLLGYLDYNQLQVPETFYLECFKFGIFRKIPKLSDSAEKPEHFN